MMERMFTGEGKERSFDKLAWARNQLRRGHSDPTIDHIARRFLKEANESAPDPEKSDSYRRYKKLVVDEFWKDHGLEVTNQLDQRFSAEPDMRRAIIPPSTEPSNDRQYARFIVAGEVLDAAGPVAQKLCKEPYGPLAIDLLSEGYWDRLEERVRSQLHPIAVQKPKIIDLPPPAQEMSDSEVNALLPVAPETAPVQHAADYDAAKDAMASTELAWAEIRKRKEAETEDARLRALFE